MPSITDLICYPIKSGGGIRLEQARIGRRGIEHDREWMLVDEDGHFLSQRTLPKMALIQPRLSNGALELRAPGLPDLRIDLEVTSGQTRVEVWDSWCDATAYPGDVDAWFSAYLERPCRLVRMAPTSVRSVDPDFAISAKDEVGFADGFPILLISSASLEDLNGRLDEPLPMNRFRPNIVVGATEPYAEDSWHRFTVRGIHFYGVKPCARCTVTTVEQETAHQGKEPLKTLATYRKHGNKVHFGMNLVHEGSGTIALGDAVFDIEHDHVIP
jgi:uncharacterized protein